MSKLDSICPQCKNIMEEVSMGGGILGATMAMMCMNDKCLFFRVPRIRQREDFE